MKHASTVSPFKKGDMVTEGAGEHVAKVIEVFERSAPGLETVFIVHIEFFDKGNRKQAKLPHWRLRIYQPSLF